MSFEGAHLKLALIFLVDENDLLGFKEDESNRHFASFTYNGSANIFSTALFGFFVDEAMKLLTSLSSR